MATNFFVRDMDLGVPNAYDNRRLEVVADGLPLLGAIQGDGQPAEESC